MTTNTMTTYKRKFGPSYNSRQTLFLVRSADLTCRIVENDLLTTIHGEECYYVACIQPRPPVSPHGRVLVKFAGAAKTFQFFPQVVGLEWISSHAYTLACREKRKQEWLKAIEEQKRRKLLLASNNTAK